ncbi:MAG TPA: triose-phosphate isomerase [Acidimicrobiales bacterium]|nr:triose-phosphate isomerase [Acidimicrobiales bacterium]
MSARPLVIGNWKMNLDHVEAVHLVTQLGVLLRSAPAEHSDVVVAPPFTDLRSVASVLAAERVPIGLCAQHVNPHAKGAHTGEVSLGMLARLGVEWVIVGHSERRAHYGMTDEVVAATLAATLARGLRAVLCVGEDEGVRAANRHREHVRDQLASALAALDAGALERLTVAYEPIWAIGTGVVATTAQAAEMTAYLRAALAPLGAGSSRVLYGGSVTAENAGELVTAGVDGFLVGGASLGADSFTAIVRAANDCYAGRR